MMNAEFCKGVEDLLEMFEDSLTPAEALYSKLTSQVSTGITKERLKLNMTQNEFASSIGTTQPLVSRWESGDCNFSLKKLADVAAALGLDVNIALINASESKMNNQYYGSLGITKTIRYTPDNFHPRPQSGDHPSRTYEDIASANFKEEYDYASIR